MKHAHRLLTGIAAATFAFAGDAHAVTLTQAQITWIVKDVRTIEPSSAARAAVLRETIQGKQAVRTGIDSRSELFFNDRTITRLGANTHFSFSEGTRDMSLERGAILLQVPKGIGGAQIDMPVVTAGITGTTIMLETQKAYTKLIVLEGKCCLWLNGGGAHTRKVCASAGQEILYYTGTKQIPEPFYINLKVLELTSKLVIGKWGVPLDQRPLVAAQNAQGSDFVPSGGTAQGGGNNSTIVTQQLFPQSTPPPTRNTPPVIVATPPPAAPTPPPVVRGVP